nr:16S rRNA (uracil(1498)-N(3))-methyltransferase [Sulfurimonas sp. SAG-AH-194-I05]
MALIYILLDEAPSEVLKLKGELFKYLIKVRRHSLHDTIAFRCKENLEVLYSYEIIKIDNRELELHQVRYEVKHVVAKKSLHVAWCVIDIKSIEKVLASLSEIGVSKISFITCERSQSNFKTDFKRFSRILEASMQQSGRSTYIEFDSYKSISSFVTVFPHVKVFDFTTKTLDDYADVSTVLIGCEGGFSKSERLFLNDKDVFRLDSPMVLRSESAVVSVASKILL